MTSVLVGAVGFLLGLGAQDLAIQALDDDTSLRPFTGTCRVCLHDRGWLRPKCATCGTTLGRELIVALTATAVGLGFLNTVGWEWILIPYLAFLFVTVALTITDLEAFRIVDRLNLGGSAVLFVTLAVTATLSGRWDDLLRGLGGAGAYFAGASILFILVRGKGFGAGDVKLAPQLGLFTAFLGWSVLGWAVFATAVIGGVIAIVLMLGGAVTRKTELPYGPPMILGAWTAIVMVGVGAIPIPS